MVWLDCAPYDPITDLILSLEAKWFFVLWGSQSVSITRQLRFSHNEKVVVFAGRRKDLFIIYWYHDTKSGQWRVDQLQFVNTGCDIGVGMLGYTWSASVAQRDTKSRKDWIGWYRAWWASQYNCISIPRSRHLSCL